MKKQNRFRKSAKANVREIEETLSLRQRLFSALALLRAWMRLKRYARITLYVVIGLLLAWWGISYLIEQARRLNIDNISYESRYDIISLKQALDILGLKDSVHLASLNPGDWERKLEAHPCIASAHIRAELPESLHIELEERLPVVFVEQESAAGTGERSRLYMDQNGCLFPVVPELHAKFNNLPVWYMQPGDVPAFRVDAQVEQKAYQPIVELAAASNPYNTTEIPCIREIFRPKEWKIILTLENGAEVLMQVYDIKGQMQRLAMIIEHARSVGKQPVSINVIPRINPTVIYAK